MTMRQQKSIGENQKVTKYGEARGASRHIDIKMQMRYNIDIKGATSERLARNNQMFLKKH